jgi:hypothetical protein
MLGRDFDENPSVRAHVKQGAPTWRTGEPLQWLQMVLKGQNASFSLLNIEGILYRLVGVQDVIAVHAGIRVYQPASPTLDNRRMRPVPAVGTAERAPIALLLNGGRVAHDGIIRST